MTVKFMPICFLPPAKLAKTHADQVRCSSLRPLWWLGISIVQLSTLISAGHSVVSLFKLDKLILKLIFFILDVGSVFFSIRRKFKNRNFDAMCGKV